MKPEHPSQESRQLRAIAQDLCQSCPPELGIEILVSGSVGWGTADADSDLDLEFWVEQLPDAETALNWLAEAGATDILPDEDPESDQIHMICRFRDRWVEASWVDIHAKQRDIKGVLTADRICRMDLVQAGNIVHAVPVRTAGNLSKWQHSLSTYPEGLQERIIQSAAQFWKFPHHIKMLWILVRRGEWLGLYTWLMADLSDALRILFAINRQWETDWKHLKIAVPGLQTKPERLLERLEQIFTEPQIEERVSITLQLLVDILDLVPPQIDVSLQKENIQSSLKAHGTSRSSMQGEL